MRNNEHRNQVADLILIDADGNDLEVVSTLKTDGNQVSFEVGNFATKERWIVVVSITQTDGGNR
jgi:hypothetical protein